jgi:hypothetical protein
MELTNGNFWKLLGTIKKLKDKGNKCLVCGSTEDIVAHHIKKADPNSKQYYSEDNLVLLCDYHHRLYHRQYPDVNPKTFNEFLIKNHSKKPVNKNKRGVIMDFTLDKELKMSKLKKIIKLVTKHNKKLVKVSVNGKLYDISKVIVSDKYATFELRDFGLINTAGDLE